MLYHYFYGIITYNLGDNYYFNPHPKDGRYVTVTRRAHSQFRDSLFKYL